MKPFANFRRKLLAAAVAVAGPAVVQAAEVSGTVEFEGDAPIPKGRIQIYIEEPDRQAPVRNPTADASLASDGGSETMEFSLRPSAGSTEWSGTRIVARLERADGWLLARGSATIADPDVPVSITLRTAMY